MASFADLEVNTDHAMTAASPKTEGLKQGSCMQW